MRVTSKAQITRLYIWFCVWSNRTLTKFFENQESVKLQPIIFSDDDLSFEESESNQVENENVYAAYEDETLLPKNSEYSYHKDEESKSKPNNKPRKASNSRLNDDDFFYSADGSDFGLPSDLHSFSVTLSIFLFLFIVVVVTMCGGWSRLRHVLAATFHKSKGSRVFWSNNGYKSLSHWNSKSA